MQLPPPQADCKIGIEVAGACRVQDIWIVLCSSNDFLLITRLILERRQHISVIIAQECMTRFSNHPSYPAVRRQIDAISCT